MTLDFHIWKLFDVYAIQPQRLCLGIFSETNIAANANHNIGSLKKEAATAIDYEVNAW